MQRAPNGAQMPQLSLQQYSPSLQKLSPQAVLLPWQMMRHAIFGQTSPFLHLGHSSWHPGGRFLVACSTAPVDGASTGTPPHAENIPPTITKDTMTNALMIHPPGSKTGTIPDVAEGHRIRGCGHPGNALPMVQPPIPDSIHLHMSGPRLRLPLL